MGLRFTDLESWQQWQDSRRRLHVLKDRITKRRNAPTTRTLDLKFWIRGTAPRLLVVCDSNSPTNHHSLLAPLAQGSSSPAVIVQPNHLELELPGTGWQELPVGKALAGIESLASIGDHLPLGAWAHGLARDRGWRQIVVQHGLLTPFSPPPPLGVEWLGWSDADARFVAEGRSDVQPLVTGSPMLAAAAANPAPQVSRFETPLFLGQLHGAELSRWSMTRSVTQFWRTTGAIYRPHPREEDKLSRAQHALWRRMGMRFDDSGDLSKISNPVVSAFSTGVLEAAARGIPAWVFHLNPPRWLEELWRRYEMSPWGVAPTKVSGSHTGAAQRVAERFHA